MPLFWKLEKVIKSAGLSLSEGFNVLNVSDIILINFNEESIHQGGEASYHWASTPSDFVVPVARHFLVGAVVERITKRDGLDAPVATSSEATPKERTVIGEKDPVVSSRVVDRAIELTLGSGGVT